MDRLIKIKNFVIEKFKKRNYRICFFGILTILLISIIAFKIFSTKKDSDLRIIYGLDNPIIVSNGDKYGYKKATGEVLLDSLYSYASPFYGEYAVVKDDEIQDNENSYKFINTKGHTVLTVKSSTPPKYYKEYNLWQVDGALYDVRLKPLFIGDYKLSFIGNEYFLYLSNNSHDSGIVDSKGQVTFKLETDYLTVSLSKTTSKENSYAVVTDYQNREMIVNLKNGKIIFELDNTEDKYLRESTDNIFRVIDRTNNYKTDRWLYIENDKISFDTKDAIYDISFANQRENILILDYGPGFLTSNHKTREEYFDIKSQKIIESYTPDAKSERELEYENTYGISLDENGHELKRKNKKIYDLKDTKVEFLDSKLYKFLLENYNIAPIILKEKGKTKIFCIKHNRVLQEFETNALEETTGSTFVMATIFKEDGYTKERYMIYNLATNQSMTVEASKTIKIFSNYITISENGKTYYYNSDFKNIHTS